MKPLLKNILAGMSLFILLGVNCYSQKISTFQKSFGGTSDDIGISTVVLPDKGVILAGITKSYGSGNNDILLIRTDSLGKRIWSKTYGGKADEGIGISLFSSNVDIILTPDSNIVVCSNTKSYGSGGADVYFLKIDLNGNVKWSKTYGGSSDDFGVGVSIDPTGGFMIVGETHSYGSGSGDVLLIKTDTAGGIVWAKAYGNASNEEIGYQVSNSVDGNYLIAGYSNESSTQYNQMWMKVDRSGKLLFDKVYGTTSYDVGQSVLQLSDKSIYVSGFTYNPFTGANTLATLFKLDSSGNPKWCKIFDKTQHSALGVLYYDNAKKVINVRFTDIISGQQRLGLMRIDTSGKLIFAKTYGPVSTSSNYTAGLSDHELVPYKSGGFIMNFATNVFGFGGWDYFYAKIDSGGNTNSCNISNLSMSPTDFTSAFSDYSYAFTTTTISPGTGSGIATTSPIVKDTLVCGPFISNFKWQNTCLGQSVSFQDSSYYKPTSWKWNFGDGSSASTSQNPNHTYSKTGSYNVKLVSSNGSVTDSITKTITILASPAKIKRLDSSICLGDSIKLDVSGTGGKTFVWNHGTLLNDSTDSTVWAYPYQNTIFTSIVTNSSGCTTIDSFIVTKDSSSKCSATTSIGGIINHYAYVLLFGYDSCQNSLTVDTASFFKKGDKALLIQAQGASINGTQTSKFGVITNYGNAGNFEYVTIDSISGTTVYLKNKPLRTYDSKGGLQLVTVPQYSGNVVINKTLTAQPWNGSKGGILIFEASGNVVSAANIDVSGMGFKGAGLVNSGHVCEFDSSWYVSSSATDVAGKKGEGICITISSEDAGKAAQANGGGGGGEHNGGGAGGSNAGQGGVGGNTWSNSSCHFPNTAQGGYKLANSTAIDKIFFGGGGGAGHENNSGGTAGTNGGGIVIIKANKLINGGYHISSDGLTNTNVAIADGSGGGGAGGTIVMLVNDFKGNNILTAKGGNGGNDNPGNNGINGNVSLGPGGGGGGGLICFSDSKPSNSTANVKPGIAGIIVDKSSSDFLSSYGADSGRSGSVLSGFPGISQGSVLRPSLKITTKSITICAGDSVQLTSTSSGIASFSWSPAGTVKNPASSNTYAYPTATTTYKLKAITSSGCALFDSVKIIVLPAKPPIPVLISGTDAFFFPDTASQFFVTEAAAKNIASISEYISTDGGSYVKTITKLYNSSAASYQFSNTGLATRKHKYNYVFIATDSCGHNSDTSVMVSPVYLRGSSGNLKNYLHFDNFVGKKIDSVWVWRQRIKPATGSWTHVATVKTTDTTYTDSNNIQCGDIYYYTIVSFTKGFSATSDWISVTPYDTTLPARVDIVDASVTSGTNIALQFNKIAKKTTRKYLIYVKKNHGAFALADSVFAKNITTSSYTYNYKVNTLTDTFSFEVFALDSCGNQSKTTEIHRSIQLNGKALEDSSYLSWSNYIGFNVKNYVIQTWLKAKGWIDYKTLPANDSVFTEVEHCNAILNFRVKAIENGGANAIAFSDSIQIKPFDTIAPARDSILSASVTNGTHINLTFNKVADADVIGYVIYRSKDHGAFLDIDTIKRPAASPIIFTDNINTLTDTFIYKVYAFDSCGNTSKTFQTHRPVQLNGKALDDSSYLSWSPYIGFTVQNYAIQIRTKTSGWIDKYTGILPSTTTFTAPGSCNDTFYYRIKTVENGGLNSIVYSDSIAITPFDTISPAKPVITYVTVLNGKSIQINWTKSVSNDVKNYNVYRNGVKIASIGNLATYTDTGLTTSKSYCYAIEAVDSCAGNKSGLSPAHCSVALNTAINGCEKSIYLSWNGYSGWSSIKKYEIYRTVNGGAESLLDSVSGVTTKFKDSLLNYHDKYCYRILAYNNGSANVSWSTQSCNQTFFVDTAQIITVTKTVTSTTNGTVIVRWKSIHKPHLAYNILYYSTDGNTFTVLQNNIAPDIDSFVHTGINTQSADYYYYLVTVDSCGTRSDSSVINKTITLTVSVGQLIHILNWTPYKGYKIKEYYIQKLDGNIFKNIDSVVATDTASRFFPAPCNSVERYRIVAVGYNPGQISWSDTMGRKAIDTIPSDAPILKNATVLNGKSTKINFTGSDSLDTYDFVVQRSTDGNWATAGDILFTTPAKALTYIDSVVNTQKQHLCYTIIARDSCLNATPSDTFCVIQLKGDSENLGDSLDWHPFKGYGIDSYAVLLYNGTPTWDTLIKVNGTDTTYIHKPLPCDVPQTYKIEGFENAGTRITMSDSITLIPFDTIKPPAPVIKFATVLDDNNIELSWHKSISKVKLYELSIKTGNGNWTPFFTVKIDTSYIFSGLNTPDSVYDFRVVAIDSCAANRSQPSVFHSPVQLGGKGQNLSNLLTWKPYEGWASVREYYIYQLKSGSWIKIDSANGNTKSYLQKGLPCDVMQAYKILAVDNTGKYSSYSDTVQLTPFDTIKPPAPIIKYATVLDDNHIQLFWHKSIPKVKLYELSIKTGNGTWMVTDTMKIDTSFIFSGLNTPDSVYDFRIVAIDSCAANRSQPSVFHSPVQLGGQGQNMSNLLTWKAYEGWTGVDKYYIYQLLNNTWKRIDSVGGTTLSYLQANLPCDVTQSYKVSALDSNGKYLSYSDTVMLTPFDTIKPPAPVIKYATVLGVNKIELYWNKSISKVKLYELSIRTGNGSWTVADTVKIDTSFIFTGLTTTDSVYDFRVVAIDSCAANRSQNSIIHSPVKVTGIPLDDTVQINWKPYEGFASVKKYYIYQLINDTWTLTDSVPGNILTYKSKTLPCNVPQAYRVDALDNTGKYLSQSDTVTVVPRDTIKPDATVLYYASILPDQNVKLSWQWDPKTDIKYFEVWRIEDHNPPVLIDTVVYDSTFIDTGADVKNHHYAYNIIAIDSCNVLNRSLVSNTDSLMKLKLRTVFCSPQVNLKWTPYKGLGSSSYLIYRSTDGKNYTDIATVSPPNLSFDDYTVKLDTQYFYMVEAAGGLGGYTSYSDTFGIVPSIVALADSAQLVYATVIRSGEKDGAILVRWRRDSHADTNARGYYVYSYNPANGKYALVEDQADLNDTTYIDNNINTLQFTYKYYIVIYNLCDLGINSKVHKPVLLTINNGDLDAHLTWQNYLGVPVKSYNVYKSTDHGQTYFLANTGIDSTLEDTNIYCHHNYTYQVQAILANAEISFSDSTTITAWDTVRPVTRPVQVATVVKTGISDGIIHLSWNLAKDKNIKGYNIYRSDNGISWFLIKQVSPGSSSSLMDSGLNTYNQSYYYKIQPFDSCGNFGDYSSYHQTIVLKTKAENSYNQLTWNGYTGWKVKKYLVFRNGRQIASFGKDTFDFRDSLVYCDTFYKYQIVAVCDTTTDTLKSYSNTDSVKSFDHVAPQKVYIKTVSVSKPNKGVTISWARSKSWDVLQYHIYRKYAVDGSMRLVGTTPYSDTTYIDSSIEATRPDCYYVFAEDHCGNISDGGNQGCIIILSARNQTNQNNLGWNGYKLWYDGVQSYNVYRNEDGHGWTMIGTTTNGAIDSFTDANIQDTTVDFCYQVEAVENPGQNDQVSRSTVVCVHPNATVFIPNSFTPFNQDGVNDMFGPKGLYIKNYTMQVYNRWGEQIYNTASGKGWDGTFHGQPVQQGIYIYYITIQDYNGNITRFKGNITMVE